MENLLIKNMGPLKYADVVFGDLTILVGPQASGKSLFLESFKLAKDSPNIIATLNNYNYIIDKTDIRPFLDYFYGEGLSAIFNNDTKFELNGNDFFKQFKNADESMSVEEVFYIPAQRILSIDDGRPRNFMEFDFTTPYVLRRFSETLRIFVQSQMGNPEVIFPIKRHLNDSLKKSFNESIFHNGSVIMDMTGGQRKMKIKIDDIRLPFMAWSAGQKEFLPLLLAFYCLSDMPSPLINKDKYKWVVIEEPEMGLHPKAIISVILEIVSLIKLGYKVIVSTHSPVFLDFAWTLKSLGLTSPDIVKAALCEMFEIEPENNNADIFDGLFSKTIKTYYFPIPRDYEGKTIDISSLDIFSENTIVSEWGGLSQFAATASEIVSKYS